MNDLTPGISKWLSAFLAAGLLASASAVAAHAAGDARAQAAALLGGKPIHPSDIQARAQFPIGQRLPARVADPQRSARGLLLGNSGTADTKLPAPLQVKATPAPAWHGAQERRARRDAQEQAHRLIEGRPA